MPDYKFQDNFVAEKKKAEDVKNENITLCVTNNSLEINFDEDAWSGVASKVISSCR